MYDMENQSKQQVKYDMKEIDKLLSQNRKRSFTQEEFSLSGVDLHTTDIHTGATLKDVRTYFLPRLDFPDVKVSYDLYESPFSRWGGLLDYPNYNEPIDFETWKYSLPSEIIKDFIHHSGLDTDRTFDFGWAENRGRSHFRIENRSLRGFKFYRILNYEGSEDSAPCHIHNGHQLRIVLLNETDSVGSDRPSTKEIFTMARLIGSEMPVEKCDFDFPQLALIFEHKHRCRILQSFFDGRLHVLFSEVLSFQHVVFEPEVESEGFYFDLVDRKGYLRILNIMLKWAWPIVRETSDVEKRTEKCIEQTYER